MDRRPVEMVALASLDLGSFGTGPHSGCWVEVQDRNGTALYRRILPHPRIRRSEGAAGDVPRTVLWVAEKGAFSVVVPNLRGGVDLVLFASPTDDPGLLGPAGETLRLPLRDRREHPTPPDTDEQGA